jgi:CO/xanthine dehydrogenase Mo-binding subunit
LDRISTRRFRRSIGQFALAQQPAPLLGSLAQNRMLDAWIRINAEGIATIFPGKVELGQGITTALTQIAAEELDLPLTACAC